MRHISLIQKRVTATSPTPPAQTSTPPEQTSTPPEQTPKRLTDRLAMWKDWKGEYAHILCHRTEVQTPKGPVYSIQMEWQGSVYAPVRVIHELEQEFLKSAPWPMVKAGESLYRGDSTYFRKDTQPVGAFLWRVRHALKTAWGRLTFRLGWCAILLGLARPYPHAVAMTYPVESWLWQKKGSGIERDKRRREKTLAQINEHLTKRQAQAPKEEAGNGK